MQTNLAVYLNQRGLMSDNNLAWFFARSEMTSFKAGMEKVKFAKYWPIDDETKQIAYQCYGVKPVNMN